MNRLVLLLMTFLVGAQVAHAAAPKGAKSAKRTAAPRSWGPAGVDWEAGVVRASGAGAPDFKAASPAQARLGAERAANDDAARRLMRHVRALPIRPGKTAAEVMAKDEPLRKAVEKALSAFRITDKRYYSDGGLEIDVDVPLGALAAQLLQSEAADRATPNSTGPALHSGLVVDARHLKVKPFLNPRLVDAKGELLYGVEMLTGAALESGGVSGFASTVNAATETLRVGNKPLVVKAVKAKGAQLFLDAAAARKLREGNAAFLSEGRVVLVLR